MQKDRIVAEQDGNRKGHLPAVGYIRMSSDKQEASPEQQREEVLQLAERDDFRIIRWHVDEAISGDRTEKRQDFQRMIADAQRGEFQAILCWDQDRFGRFDSIEAGHWIYPLRQSGVRLVTVAQGAIDWNGFAGRMLFSIQQEGKHQFLNDLARNVARGLREKAKRGEWPGGRPPFGFAVGDNGRLVLGDPLHVRAVQRVFQKYLAGTSLRGIVEEMTDEEEPAPGEAWNVATVRNTLTIELYTGDSVWGDRQVGRYHFVTDEPINLPNNHLAIISRETFDAVQRRREACRRKRTTPHRNGGGFVLSGLLYCASCDSRMSGLTIKGNQYFLCSGHQKKGTCFCDRNSVREDVVLGHVIAAIEDEYLNPVTVKRLREELYRQVQPCRRVDAKQLRKKLAEVEKQLTTAKRNMVLADADMLPEFTQAVRELRGQQERLSCEIKKATMPRQEQLAELDLKVDAALELFSHLRETLEQARTTELREFLRQAIHKISIRVTKTKEGKRDRYHLAGGEIHMNVDNLEYTPEDSNLTEDTESVVDDLFGRFCSRKVPCFWTEGSRAVAKRKPKSPIIGRWNIVSMTAWDLGETVEELQPFIKFERNEGGQLQFGCVHGEMDCRLTERDGKPAAEFSWEGHDEDEQVFGRGWAIMEGDQLEGMVFLHHGDESGFVAERAEG